jgi:hypothetical protein
MTAVTTDGARIGVEHSDLFGCSFPFFLVTAPSRPRPVSRVPGADTAHRDPLAPGGQTHGPAAATTRARAE